MHPIWNISPFVRLYAGTIRNGMPDDPRVPTPEHLPVHKALLGDDPGRNAGTIHASNPEHLPVFKALHVGNPERNAGTIHGRRKKRRASEKTNKAIK